MTLFERLKPLVRFRQNKHPNTTPVFDQSNRNALIGGGLKLLAIPLVPLALLLWFGHPALRLSYQWNGNDRSPVYYSCNYLAADGWHVHRPAFDARAGNTQCPAVIFLPFTLTDLKGVVL